MTLMQKKSPPFRIMLGFIAAGLITIGTSPQAFALKPQSANAMESVQRSAETQIRNLVEPLLDKYCHDECKYMSATATVDLSAPDQIAPGFDDFDTHSAATLAPSSARAKILIDEKVGPVSRSKLLELIQQYLDTLEYPVKIETQVTRFPQPVGSAAKIAELRERITKQFRNTVEDIFRQFCPDQCLLADYSLQTDVVNAEEAQYGATGEFVEDGGIALRIRHINATILVDDTLPPEEAGNILEMAKLKTNSFKNVNLDTRIMKFPRPVRSNSYDAGNGGNGLARGLASSSDNKSSKDSKDSKETKDSKLVESKNSDTKNQELNNTESKSDSKSTNKSQTSNQVNSTENNNRTESNNKQERFERIEKIERVESGDAVQAELQKFKVYGLVFGCAVLSLLIFIAMACLRPRSGGMSTLQRVMQQMTSDPAQGSGNDRSSRASAGSSDAPNSKEERNQLVAKRYEIERLIEELMAIFAQQPRVAKQVFSRVLTEEGVETTAQYIHIFGESVVIDMLRDPSLQADIGELMEFYAKNTFDIDDDEKLDLLQKLHNRTVAGKLVVMGSRSSHLFDFLADMDGLQIMELIRNESLTVKSIVMTQCDPQKRSAIYSQLDEENRMKLLSELSRIDYLPRDYIFNVANALKRKRRENPRLNTEALPGSDVLLTLLERTNADMQRTVVRNLEINNPESARMIKSKLVSLDTLRHLRDGQLLEVVLSLRHDELLIFLKGTPNDIRGTIFAKAPKDLTAELEEELAQMPNQSREAYQALERKVLNRMKLMANEGLINLVETNERMFANGASGETGFIEAGPVEGGGGTNTSIRKAAGW